MATWPPLSACNDSRSLTPSSLKIGDIIVSTTEEALSAGIRFVDGSPASHVMVYAGSGNVAEAIADGVVVRSLQDALDDASLAVVYRSPNLSFSDALSVVTWAASHEGAPYDYSGVVLSPFESICGRIESQDEFFCSELATAAYNEAGVDLTGESPACSTPSDIVEQYAQGDLDYAGHLIANDGNALTVHTGHDYDLRPQAEQAGDGSGYHGGYHQNTARDVCTTEDYYPSDNEMTCENEEDVFAGDPGEVDQGGATYYTRDVCTTEDYYPSDNEMTCENGEDGFAGDPGPAAAGGVQ